MLETINTDSLAFEVGAEFYWEVRKPALPMSSNMPQCLRRRPNTSHFERELALRKLVQSLEIELEFGRTWSQSLPMPSVQNVRQWLSPAVAGDAFFGFL